MRAAGRRRLAPKAIYPSPLISQTCLTRSNASEGTTGAPAHSASTNRTLSMIPYTAGGEQTDFARPWLAHYEPQVPVAPEIPDVTLHELFEATVRAYPDNIATIFFGERLTYGQLNEQ